MVGPTARIRSALHWLLRLVGEVYSGWVRHRCSQLGAAIAFYGIFALLPMLILLTSVFGFILASWGGAASFKDSLFRIIAEGVSPQIAQTAIAALGATEQAKGSLGLVGIATLLLAGTGAFGMLDNSLQVVWDLHVTTDPVPFRIQVIRFIRTRLVSFLLVVGAALLAFISLVTDIVLDMVARSTGEITPSNLRLAELGLGFFASGLIVTLLFRWLPMRRVPWAAAFTGGFLTALLWEGARQGLSAYLTRKDYARAYPILGSALAILIWVYIGGLVFLLGAEVAAAITRMLAERRIRRLGDGSGRTG